MDPSERALASFLDDDEELLETWDVKGIVRGLSMSVPQMGDGETLALSDQRLLWLEGDLKTVRFEDVRDLEPTSMDASGAGLLALLGGLALLIGLVVTPILWVVTSLSPLLTLAPLGIGVVSFLLALIGANLTEGGEGDGPTQHYLQVRTTSLTVQIFDDKETVSEIHTQIDEAIE